MPDISRWVNFSDVTPGRVTTISHQRGEPRWLLNYRLAALSRLTERHISPYWPEGGFDKPPSSDEISRYWEHPDEADMVYRRLTETLEAQGIIYGDFFDVLRTHPALVHDFLGSIVHPEENPLSSLNAMLFTGGMILYVPPGVTCTVPLSYFRSAANPGQVEHHLLWLDQDAHADFVEGRPSLSYAPAHLVQAEVRLRPRASLRHIAVKNWGADVSTWVSKRILCEEDSALTWIEGHFGGRSTDETTEVFLEGDNAQARLVTCSVAEAHQSIHYHPQVFHVGNHTRSEFVHRFFSHGGSVDISGGMHILRGSKDAKLTRDVVAVGPSELVELHDGSMMLETADTLSGPLWTSASSGQWMPHAASSAAVADALAEPFLKELPMEFSIEAQRLIRQKSQD